jgi:hypothetical protein
VLFRSGTSVQEQSKKEDFCKRLMDEFDFNISCKEISVYLMSDEDYNLFLASKDLINEDYSNQLFFILANNCQKLTNAIAICSRSMELRKHSTILKNYHSRILNGDKPLSLDKTIKVNEVMKSLEMAGLNLTELVGDIDINVEKLFNIEVLVEKLEEIKLSSVSNSEEIDNMLEELRINNGFTRNQLIRSIDLTVDLDF